MRKDINDRLEHLEYRAGIKEGLVLFEYIDPSSKNITYGNYTYNYDTSGNKQFYKNGILLSQREINNIKTIILDDII